jgi:hypothetical protein
VADEFKYGSDRNVVVALEDNVLMVNKRELLKVSPLTDQRRIVLNGMCLSSLLESPSRPR